MQIRRARLPRLLFVLVGASALVAVLHSQRPFVQPELFSGEWETTTASGVHGIHLYIRTYDGPQPQAISIRVYHRQNGQETRVWWGDNGSVSPDFDGVRVRVRDLDVTFDSQTRRWTGTWLLDGELKAVVLEKPTCQSHPLCGMWEDRGSLGNVRLHLVQSTDGFLTAWMDRSLPDQRHGEHLRVVSSDPSGLEVQTTHAGGLPIRFTLRLTNPSTLEGDWNARSPGQDTRVTFHRVH
jgi:hypothetical protein